jgi:hypothetical protein
VQLVGGKAVEVRGALGDQPVTQREMADQRTGFAQLDLGAEVKFARLADVVQQRGADQEIGVETRVEAAGVECESGDRDRVLEEPAEVGVMTGAGAGRAP